MPEPEKPYGSIRRYGAADLARVRFIVRAAARVQPGKSALLETPMAHSETRQLAEQKLVAVRQKLSDLQRIESVLAAWWRDVRPFAAGSTVHDRVAAGRRRDGTAEIGPVRRDRAGRDRRLLSALAGPQAGRSAGFSFPLRPGPVRMVAHCCTRSAAGRTTPHTAACTSRSPWCGSGWSMASR